MAKFCIYCDSPITDGKTCPCRARVKGQKVAQATTATSPTTEARSSREEPSQPQHKTQQKNQSHPKAQTNWATIFTRLQRLWQQMNIVVRAQEFWQSLTEFIYQPSKITTQLDQVKPTSPFFLVLVQLILIYLWAINFLYNTNLGHFLRYTEKTYLDTTQNFASRIAVNIVFILVVLHLAKLVFTYLCLRIQHYHVTWKQVYRLGLPANIVSTLSILVSFLFLYGSGFISLGILLFSCMAASCMDFLTLKNNFKFPANRALLFTWILYLLLTIAVAGTVDLMFPHISSFYMNTGISF